MKQIKVWNLCITLLLLLIAMTSKGATNIPLATTPISLSDPGKPFIQFIMDDSGSMNFETIMKGNKEGAMYWDTNLKDLKSGTSLLFSGDIQMDMVHNLDACWNGSSSNCADACDCAYYGYIPPTPQFGYARSVLYNTMYYDPSKTYTNWNSTASNYDGPRSYPASNPTAAIISPKDLSSATINLTVPRMAGPYYMRTGQQIPAGSYVKNATTGVWAPVVISYTTTEDAQTFIPEYIPSYWEKQTCTVDNMTCINDIYSGTLKKVEIKPGNTFSSGRSYSDEIQNFANWFTFYRTRGTALASAVSAVLTNASGFYSRVIPFNATWTPKDIFDMDSVTQGSNGMGLTYLFYQNGAGGNTPTREALLRSFSDLTSDTTIIRNACQKNHSIIVTDGNSMVLPVLPPAYDTTKYGSVSPYSTTYPGTIADIALYGYTTNFRTDLPLGVVPIDQSTNYGADKNPNIHMNTHAITLGVTGSIWPANTSPYTNTPVWVNPTDEEGPDAADDLYHATINGRGTMSLAMNSHEIQLALKSMLANFALPSNLVSKVYIPQIDVGAEPYAYLASYVASKWVGDLKKYAIDPVTGQLSGNAIWSLADNINKMAPSSRIIGIGIDNYSSNPLKLDFTTANASTIGAYLGISADTIDWVRGVRTKEVSSFKIRNSALGPITVNNGATKTDLKNYYVPDASGLLHAVDKSTGQEKWAVILPATAYNATAKASSPWENPITVLDSAISVSKLTNGKTILVGSYGPTVPGVYALDVSDETASTGQDAANKILWSYPRANTAASLANNVGKVMGKPIVVTSKTKGDVVLFTSGYNNTAGDSQAHLFVMNATSGAMMADIKTNQPIGATPRGLVNVSAFKESDGTTQFVYGADDLGSFYKFDIDAGTVTELAKFTRTDASTQSVFAAPEITTYKGKKLFAVATGRLSSNSDITSTATESLYVFLENNYSSMPLNIKSSITNLTHSVSMTGTDGILTPPAGFEITDDITSTKNGWYIDFTSGEKTTTDVSIYGGMLTFTTNKTSPSTCSFGSYTYIMDVVKGMPTSGTTIAYFNGMTTSAQTVVAKTTDNKLKALTRLSDNTVKIRDMVTIGSSSGSVVLKKVAVKQDVL